jgi:serine/threonine protein kinase
MLTTFLAQRRIVYGAPDPEPTLNEILNLIAEEQDIHIIMTPCLEISTGTFLKRKTAYFSSMSWWQIVKILRDIFAGLAFLHALGYMHRDINPASYVI